MHCSGCGKNIPFGGRVCPHCQRDKANDQQSHVLGVVALIIGGAIGNAVGGFSGMIVGGLLLGLFVAIVTVSSANHSAKKPPRVSCTRTRIDHSTPANADPLQAQRD